MAPLQGPPPRGGKGGAVIIFIKKIRLSLLLAPILVPDRFVKCRIPRDTERDGHALIPRQDTRYELPCNPAMCCTFPESMHLNGSNCPNVKYDARWFLHCLLQRLYIFIADNWIDRGYFYHNRFRSGTVISKFRSAVPDPPLPAILQNFTESHRGNPGVAGWTWPF